jgi:hypothetical protein
MGYSGVKQDGMFGFGEIVFFDLALLVLAEECDSSRFWLAKTVLICRNFVFKNNPTYYLAFSFQNSITKPFQSLSLVIHTQP